MDTSTGPNCPSYTTRKVAGENLFLVKRAVRGITFHNGGGENEPSSRES
jgi:hypothetical protein